MMSRKVEKNQLITEVCFFFFVMFDHNPPYCFLFENSQQIVKLSYISGLVILTLCSSSVDEGDRMAYTLPS